MFSTTRYAPLHEVREDLSKKTQRFYASLWGVEPNEQSTSVAALGAEAFVGSVPRELLAEVRSEVEVTQQMIREFNDATVRA